MRTAAIALLLVLGVACGEGSSSTGTPPLDPEIAQRCRRVFDAPVACIDCIEASCCADAVRCGEDLRCKPCLQPGRGTECGDPPPEAAEALLECKRAHCDEACEPSFVGEEAAPDCDAPEETTSASCVTIGAPRIACDPLTNTGCLAEEVCAVGYAVFGGSPPSATGFVCQTAGVGRAICEECGESAWDTCAPGLHCIGQCARFCCADADCGFGGLCNRPLIANLFNGDPPHDQIGVCEAAP